MPPDFSVEASHAGRVAGVDEAGRGPLAGPVLAAAVIFLSPPVPALAALLDDSKRLTAEQRDIAYAALLTADVCFAIAAASAVEIGRLNILGATHLAMRRAVLRLRVMPGLALIDGNRAPALPCETRCIIGGDGLCLSIAAASILAKVTRDRAMRRLCARWPAYGFSRHVGYATAMHRAALAQHGPCPHHRRGFAAVEEAHSVRAA
ncbi:ribonuclease HII [Plastoroseomonas arctica]|uniref:Ribonuclease HII n=1 Tax=Plastoroseomonas arctica TaxID=1509237 RepID=A0AAF1JZ79_9PROT|nr:ribonuclease HII [Plastoroseomonas arctica]MBR0657559.1 ribonuclease HII [Plastoroseomonas arctica]